MKMPEILSYRALGATPAIVPETAVRQVAADQWGLTGKFERFESEKDETYRIRLADGQSVVLKIANPSETESDLVFQSQLLSCVASADPTLPIPRVLPDRDGNTLSHWTDPDGRKRLVRVLSFLEGVPLSRTQSSAKEREIVGTLLAKLRHATSHWNDEAEHPLAWDVRHLSELTPLLEWIDDPELKRLLHRGLDRFLVHTTGLEGLRRQMLHNDFSRSNLVVDHNDPRFVTGIIDFGDATNTALAVDVSTALLNQLPAEPHEDMLSDGHDVLRGYLRYAELDDVELTMIPHLIMGRIITRTLITTWRARQFPAVAKYAMRNTPQGQMQLSWFLDQDPTFLSQQFLERASSASAQNIGGSKCKT